MPSHPGRVILFALLVTALAASAEQPPPPCHPNPDAAADSATVAARGDVASLPQPLKNKLVRLADRPHSILPVQARAEADAPSQLFQSYLLDTTGLEPNVFTRPVGLGAEWDPGGGQPRSSRLGRARCG